MNNLIIPLGDCFPLTSSGQGDKSPRNDGFLRVQKTLLYHLTIMKEAAICMKLDAIGLDNPAHWPAGSREQAGKEAFNYLKGFIGDR